MNILYHCNSKRSFNPYIELFNKDIKLPLKNKYNKNVYGFKFYKDKIEFIFGLKIFTFNLPWQYIWYKTEVKLKSGEWLEIKDRDTVYKSDWKKEFYFETHKFKYNKITTTAKLIIIRRIFKMKKFKKTKTLTDIEVRFRKALGKNNIIGTSYKLIDNEPIKSLKELERTKNFDL